MSLGVSPRAERWAVTACSQSISCALRLGVYSTAKTAADLIKEERTQSESPGR